MAVPHDRLVAIVEAIHRLALASEVEGKGEVAIRGLEDLLCSGGSDRDRQRKEQGEDKRTWFHDCLYIMVYKNVAEGNEETPRQWEEPILK